MVEAADRARGTRAPLIALAVAAFGIGTTEFVIMGLLPQVAADLRVGLPAAGLLVSGYALGVAFGGPVLAALLVRVPARGALIGLMGLFIVGNLAFAVCAMTQGMVIKAASAAPNLASTLNISAFNLGNAIGAGLSAAALSAGLGLGVIPVLAAMVATLAVGAAAISAAVAPAEGQSPR